MNFVKLKRVHIHDQRIGTVELTMQGNPCAPLGNVQWRIFISQHEVESNRSPNRFSRSWGTGIRLLYQRSHILQRVSALQSIFRVHHFLHPLHLLKILPKNLLALASSSCHDSNDWPCQAWKGSKSLGKTSAGEKFSHICHGASANAFTAKAWDSGVHSFIAPIPSCRICWFFVCGQELSDGDLIEWNAAYRFVSFETVLLLKRDDIHFLHYFNQHERSCTLVRIFPS